MFCVKSHMKFSMCIKDTVSVSVALLNVVTAL